MPIREINLSNAFDATANKPYIIYFLAIFVLLSNPPAEIRNGE